jgi:hypothetical protein
MTDKQSIQSLRESHNEMAEELAQADTAEERAFIRGKRAGLLQAIATLHHFDSDDTPRLPSVTTASQPNITIPDRARSVPPISGHKTLHEPQGGDDE